MFGLFNNFFYRDIGVDLGTANTLVYTPEKGIILREPSVVAIRTSTNEVVAVGNLAKEMLGRTPGDIVAIRPLRDGVIADFEIAEVMLRYFIRKVTDSKSITYPRVLIAIPSGTTEVERRAVKESAENAGAKEVYLIEEAMAAAIGAGLSIQNASGNMIIDIGGGTTEIAIISYSGIVNSLSVRTGGDELDEAIINHTKRVYNLMIGERTAEEIKISLGSAFPGSSRENSIEVKGRDLLDGLPKTITLNEEEVRQALISPLSDIVNGVKSVLETCPPELAVDIIDQGFVLAGGGALLGGIDKLLSKETGLTVRIANRPLTAVAEGTGKALSEIELLQKIL